jgi:hypothetical protein
MIALLYDIHREAAAGRRGTAGWWGCTRSCAWACASLRIVSFMDGDELVDRGGTPWWTGDEGRAQEYIDAGGDPNAKSHGWPLLVVVARRGHICIAERLVRANANLELRSSGGDTALTAAAYEGEHEMVEWLLGEGANPSAKGAQGKTALQWAQDRGHGEMAAMLSGVPTAAAAPAPWPAAVDHQVWGSPAPRGKKTKSTATPAQAKRMTDDAKFELLRGYYLDSRLTAQRGTTSAAFIRSALAKHDFEILCTKLQEKYGLHPLELYTEQCRRGMRQPEPEPEPTATPVPEGEPGFLRPGEGVAERRAQAAEAAAARQMAKAEAQMQAARFAEEQAREATEEAQRQAAEQMTAARQAQETARLAELRAEVAAAQQVAEAEAQMLAARSAEERAREETEKAQRQAAAQMTAAREARERAQLAEVRAEAANAAAARERVTLPPEWTSVSDSAGVDFVDVPEKCGFFGRKIKHSAKVTAATTAAQSMDRLRVHRVVRVENAPLFESYQRERVKIRKRLDHTRAAGTAVARLEEHTPDWLAAQTGFPAVIDSESNEFWLWHGTSASINITHPDGSVQRQETWEVLARHGFDERVGGDSNGGLYGKGIYLADAASKANQYATAPIATPPMNAAGHHCMLSCRVTMGDPYRTPGSLQGQRRPPNNPATPGLPYDSVFAQEGVTDNGQGGGAGSQFHNEYVVFSKAQVYPEYVIWYTK